MSQPTTLLKLTLLTLATLALVFLIYLGSLTVVAVATGGRPTSTTSMAVMILIVGQVVLACLSIAYVFYLSGGYFHGFVRLVWAIPFAVIQLVMCALAMFTTLLAFNR